MFQTNFLYYTISQLKNLHSKVLLANHTKRRISIFFILGGSINVTKMLEKLYDPIKTINFVKQLYITGFCFISSSYKKLGLLSLSVNSCMVLIRQN